MTPNTKRAWMFLFSGILFGLTGCAGPNLVVRHRSQVKRPIQVYLNWRLHCVVLPDSECKSDLKPGRYFFYALISGMPTKRWASPQNPAPFSVDKRTIINLHDKRNTRPSRPGGLSIQGRYPRQPRKKRAASKQNVVAQ